MEAACVAGGPFYVPRSEAVEVNPCVVPPYIPSASLARSVNVCSPS